jgi:hypothetical protein
LLPGWVLDCEAYLRWFTPLLEVLGADPPAIDVAELPLGVLLDETSTSGIQILRTHRPLSSFRPLSLTFEVTVVEYARVDGQRWLEETQYSYHLATADHRMVWRYDLHGPDHHAVGTDTHVHLPQGTDEVVKSSAHVDLGDLMDLILEEHTRLQDR